MTIKKEDIDWDNFLLMLQVHQKRKLYQKQIKNGLLIILMKKDQLVMKKRQIINEEEEMLFQIVQIGLFKNQQKKVKLCQTNGILTDQL